MIELIVIGSILLFLSKVGKGALKIPSTKPVGEKETTGVSLPKEFQSDYPEEPIFLNPVVKQIVNRIISDVPALLSGGELAAISIGSALNLQTFGQTDRTQPYSGYVEGGIQLASLALYGTGIPVVGNVIGGFIEGAIGEAQPLPYDLDRAAIDLRRTMPYPIPEREIDKLWYYLVYAPSVARFYGWLNDKFSNNITYMGQNNLLEGKAFSFTNSEIISKWHQITFYRDVPAAIPRMVTRRGRTINVNTYRADDNI